MHDYDLIVIGSGPAGQRAGVQAAKLGKKVAIIERNFEIGGVSVHTGTIPSKTMREAVLYLTGWRQRSFYGQGHRERTSITPEDVRHRVKITLQHQVEVMCDQLSRNGGRLVVVFSATSMTPGGSKLSLVNKALLIKLDTPSLWI